MISSSPDAIVIGLGAHGSAAACHLSRLGARVIGIDRFAPPHGFGSSHGASRITRLAVGEGAQFVPLVRRSHELWRDLEALTGRALYLPCGGLVIGGPPGGSRVRTHGQLDFVGQTIELARRHGIAHELLDAAGIQARFPQFSLRGDETGYFEPEAGVLYPEACIEAHLAQARARGAELVTGERVTSIEQRGSQVTVFTERRRYVAAHVVVCAGAWTAQLLGAPWSRLLRVSRQTLHWFRSERPALYAPGRCPVFIWIHGNGDDDAFYGVPQLDDSAGALAGIKVGAARYGEPVDPDAIERCVTADESIGFHQRHIRSRLNAVTADVVASAACLYTLAPASNFVVDQHPTMPSVTVVSACSGHGFKHSAALGEALAQRLTSGRSVLDLSAFALPAC